MRARTHTHTRTHCRLNDLEEEKDDFDVLNERPGKLWNLDPRNSNRTDANTVRRLSETEVNSSTYPSIISWRMAGASLDQARPNAPDTPAW